MTFQSPKDPHSAASGVTTRASPFRNALPLRISIFQVQFRSASSRIQPLNFCSCSNLTSLPDPRPPPPLKPPSLQSRPLQPISTWPQRNLHTSRAAPPLLGLPVALLPFSPCGTPCRHPFVQKAPPPALQHPPTHTHTQASFFHIWRGLGHAALWLRLVTGLTIFPDWLW